MIGIVLYPTSFQPEQVVPVCFFRKRCFACPILACVYKDLNNPARFRGNDTLRLGQLLGDCYPAEAGAISEFLALPKTFDGSCTLWCGYIGSPA